MKTIKLKSVHVREIRIRPNDAEPTITVFYDILDEDGNAVGTKDFQTALTEANADTLITRVLKLLGDKDLK